MIGFTRERILRVLHEYGGFTSGQVARKLGYQDIRSSTQILRRDLLAMERDGLVRRIDDLSPTAWQRTAAGTAAAAGAAAAAWAAAAGAAAAEAAEAAWAAVARARAAWARAASWAAGEAEARASRERQNTRLTALVMDEARRCAQARWGGEVTAAALLTQLSGLGVTAWADGGTLRFKPASLIPPDVLADMRAHKAELLALLAAPIVPEHNAAPRPLRIRTVKELSS